MSKLYQNAIISIKMGIEDYQSNDPDRLISAIRNFYAGVLLLGKECLISSAPKADPKIIIASNYVPTLSSHGRITFKPRGQRTIDLDEMKGRFKSFKLPWPGGDINTLQTIRNDFEHYYANENVENIRQTIAGCFPLVEAFFRILKKVPSKELGDTWSVMLEEKSFFLAQKQKCNDTFQNIAWGDVLSSIPKGLCTACGSSLIFQEDEKNSDPASIKGECEACGQCFTAQETVTMIVNAMHWRDHYYAQKDASENVIFQCGECGEETYVYDGEINFCYYCDYSVEGECSFCSDNLTPYNQSSIDSSMCDYCIHIHDKWMRE